MADVKHPRHGRGSLAHGYVAACGDLCNNAQCAKGLNHGRCTEECTPDVVWDEMGCWYPGAPHLQSVASEDRSYPAPPAGDQNSAENASPAVEDGDAH